MSFGLDYGVVLLVCVNKDLYAFLKSGTVASHRLWRVTKLSRQNPLKRKRQNEYKHQAFENSSSLASHFPHSFLSVSARRTSRMLRLFQSTQICFGQRNCVLLSPMHVRNQHRAQQLHKIPCSPQKGSLKSWTIPLELGSLTISLPPVVNRHLECFSKERRSKVTAEDISSFSKDCQSDTRQSCSPSMSKEIFPSRSAKIRAGALPANSWWGLCGRSTQRWQEGIFVFCYVFLSPKVTTLSLENALTSPS